MNREAALIEVKKYLPDYLQSKGLSLYKPFNCLNPEHQDKSPSMSYNKNANNVHCFSCNCTYSLIDLIGIEYGITDTKEMINKAYELYNISIDQEDHIQRRTSGRATAKATAPEEVHQESNKAEATPELDPYIINCSKYINETDYLIKRGISLNLQKKYLIGYDKKQKNIIIPTGRDTYIKRSIDPEASGRYRNKGNSKLFNDMLAFMSDKPIYIVEGAIDCLSFLEVGAEAIALNSIANTKLLIDTIKEQLPEQALILALDNDEPGQKAQKKLAEELEVLEVSFYCFNPYGSYKDGNEALVKDKEAFSLKVKEGIEETIKYIESSEEERKQKAEEKKQKEKEEYINKYAANKCLQSFINDIAKDNNNSYYPTGFKYLDEKLNGGFYKGNLHVLGAVSSLGKTTFIQQIVDQIAEQRKDILYFSLEMSKYQLISKSISRYTLQQCIDLEWDYKLAKSARDITNYDKWEKYTDKEKALIKTAFNIYNGVAEKIYIIRGCGDIGAEEINTYVEEHIKITGNYPVVIVDYLQILKPYDFRASDKQNNDKSILLLKDIAVKYNIPVIAISSFNRENYITPVHVGCYKESGNIEYTADVLLALQYNNMDYIENEKQSDREKRIRELIKDNERKGREGSSQEIQLKILKQRLDPKNEQIFNYFPRYNYFMEIEKKTVPRPGTKHI